MLRKSVFAFGLVITIIIIAWACSSTVMAGPPYSSIRVLSLHLDPYTDAAEIDTYGNTISCQLGHTAYGCGYTWSPNYGEYVEGYPYTDNPKGLLIDTQYLPHVVPFETNPNDGFNYTSLKAQSVAARTYSYYFVDHPDATTYDLNNSAYRQYFQANGKIMRVAHAQTDAAIAETSGLYLRSNINPWGQSKAIFSEFGADHDPALCGVTGSCVQPDYYTVSGGSSHPYLKSIYDPITNGEDPNEKGDGHGHGLSQQGAKKWGVGENSQGNRFPKWDYTKILAHYYTNAHLVNTNGIDYWGAYRWNLLRLIPSDINDIYYDGENKTVTLTIQNTGTIPWQSGTKLIYCWQRTIQGVTECSSWYTAVTSLPMLSPGFHTVQTLTIAPPAGTYNKNATAYQLVWDLQLSGGTKFSDQGWLTQAWDIKLRKKVPPPSAPTPPQCSPAPCQGPMNASPFIIQWWASSYDENFEYNWRTTTDAGSTIATGSVPSTQTNATIPLIQGNNSIAVRGRDTDTGETSPWVSLTTVYYDSTPPTINSLTTLPEWSNISSLNLAWQATDAETGIASYMLEQELNESGTWTILVSNPTTTSYNVTNLLNNTNYQFRLTVRDNAGNSQTALRSVKIDRNVPIATLTIPTGTLTKTWTILRWNASPDDGRSLVTFTIDRFMNGTWQSITTVTNRTQTTALFVGQPNTSYSLRIIASDAAGNQQPTSPNAHITFTTGIDSSGLFTSYLPILLKEGTATATSSSATSTNPTNAYPLPEQ